MKIVVDTNIVFSAILNVDSRIAHILLYNDGDLQFFSCDFLKLEIAKHKRKILKATKYSDSQFSEIEFLVTKNIHFMNQELIHPVILTKANDMLRNIDLDDAPFLALTISLKAKLWTGDRKLANGLMRQDFKELVITEDLAR